MKREAESRKLDEEAGSSQDPMTFFMRTGYWPM